MMAGIRETRQLSASGLDDAQASDSVRTTLEVLQYNQNLVQLADNKAGNLIVINSIFLASVTSFLVSSSGEGAAFLQGYQKLFQIAFFAASVMAIFACLRLIMTKGDFSERIRHMDLIFFGDIVHRKNSDGYIFEYTKARPKHLLHDILRRTYATAKIADSKFNFCRNAQNYTLLSSALWLVNIFLIALK